MRAATQGHARMQQGRGKCRAHCGGAKAVRRLSRRGKGEKVQGQRRVLGGARRGESLVGSAICLSKVLDRQGRAPLEGVVAASGGCSEERAGPSSDGRRPRASTE